MRGHSSAILAAIGLCFSQPVYAAPAQAQAQDSDYQSMLRCYGFHFFKIELGTTIEKPEIAESGRDQSALDMSALQVYAKAHGLTPAAVQIAAEAEAKARRATYLDPANPKRQETLMGDQEFCSSEAFVDILLKYQ